MPDTARVATEASGSEELRALGRELALVYLGVKVLLGASVGTSLVGAVLQALSPGSIGPEDGVHLGSIVLTTAPLTFGFAAAVYLYLAGWGRWHPFAVLAGWTAIAVISLFIAGAIGHLDAEESPSAGTSPYEAPPRFHPLVAVIGITLWGYLSVYGAGLFACALLIGGYAGWKWHSLTREGATS